MRLSLVYNIGGGKENSCSIVEAFALTEAVTGKRQLYSYREGNRIGDHICYYSDLRKMKAHFPKWGVAKSLEVTIAEIVKGWAGRLAG